MSLKLLNLPNKYFFQEFESVCFYTANEQRYTSSCWLRVVVGETARSVVKRTPRFADPPMRWRS
jgi:hypothetical protein